MQRRMAVIRCAALAAALALSACAHWFAPESAKRGEIFDAASRGVIPLDLTDVRQRLDDRIRQAFPPGTQLADVTRHIVDAGGVCSNSTREWAKPGYERTVCSYRREIYFARQIVFMGEPAFWLTRNDWTVDIAHRDDLVGWYVVEGQAPVDQLSRDDYLAGLERQRAEEELARTTD